MLFVLLMRRYNVQMPKLPRGVSAEEYERKHVTPIQLRVVNVLKMWLEQAFFDFTTPLLAYVERFATQILRDERFSAQIMNTIAKQV